MLEDNDRVAVVASMSPGELAVPRARETSADVALLDLSAREGLVEARRVLSALPELKIVGVGGGESDGEVIAWAEAGIAGCLCLEASLDDLLAVVESVARGEVLCSPRTVAVLLRRVAGLGPNGAQSIQEAQLTQRQVEILSLIEHGFSNKEIARKLCIEPATVKNHVHTILEKLHVHRRADAAAWARRSGLAAERQLRVGVSTEHPSAASVDGSGR